MCRVKQTLELGVERSSPVVIGRAPWHASSRTHHECGELEGSVSVCSPQEPEALWSTETPIAVFQTESTGCQHVLPMPTLGKSGPFAIGL